MKIKDIVLKIEELSFQEGLEYIVEKSLPAGRQDKKGDNKTFVVTINPEIIMLARNDAEYEKVLISADLALADGVGVLWAGKMFGKSFKERVHGVDLVEGLAKEVAGLPAGRQEKPITVGFLGGKENVAQEAADCLKKKYPKLKVAFAIEEWDGAEVADKISETARAEKVQIEPGSKAANSRFENFASSPRLNHKSSIINHKSCDILFVAFGSPKQEKWIYNHIKEIDSKVFIGVGGAFDFISGKVMRAPMFVRRLGLEWLFRLIIQPWRIKRQFALIKFVLQVLREKLK